jgi:type IV pilus assembly protein PilV
MGTKMKPSRNQTDCLNSDAEKCRRECGFTLIEVMIALTIFAVGMLAIATMQLSAIKVNARANSLTQRTSYAQDKIEELVALPYTDGELDNGFHAGGTNTDGFTISWDITVDFPVPNVKLIDVTVTGDGQETVFTHAKADL